MSSRNEAMRGSYHGSKKSSRSRSRQSDKSKQQQKKSTDSRPSSSQKLQKQPTSSMRVTDAATAPVHHGSMMSVPDSGPDENHVMNMGIYDWTVRTQADLIGVSAWTNPHQGPHDYQVSSYPYNDSTQTSACPYHQRLMDLSHDVCESAYGLWALERWLNEGAGDGGPLALQLGHQLHADCTCMLMHGGMGEEDGVNGKA